MARRRVLVVEDDPAIRRAIVDCLAFDGYDTLEAGTFADARRAGHETQYDLLLLDLILPGDDGFHLMETVRAKNGSRELPVIVYTGKDLTPEDDEALKKHAQSVILKSAVHSPERLLSETMLFLHRVESRLPERSKAALAASRHSEASVAGRKVLVVDDDVRNIFAMTSVLEASGLEVIYAENGQAGIEALAKDPAIDLVLMDVMMPGMDGYETIRAIRANPVFRGIPIVAVTAKALKEDRAKCLEAGASDYLPKPVDTEKLLDLIRLWTGSGEGVPLQ